MLHFFSDKASRPSGHQSETNGDTSQTYTNGTSASTVPFYIDEKGNLRCFYSIGSGNSICSYVYGLTDNQYVKTEALQRVLANFSSKLSERSPSSKISAVKFSANVADAELEKLVLLD